MLSARCKSIHLNLRWKWCRQINLQSHTKILLLLFMLLRKCGRNIKLTLPVFWYAGLRFGRRCDIWRMTLPRCSKGNCHLGEGVHVSSSTDLKSTEGTQQTAGRTPKLKSLRECKELAGNSLYEIREMSLDPAWGKRAMCKFSSLSSHYLHSGSKRFTSSYWCPLISSVLKANCRTSHQSPSNSLWHLLEDFSPC